MAIQMRRGQLANYDKSKMLPGEWGISIDNDSDNQKAFIAFAPGVDKEVLFVEDAEPRFSEMTEEATEEAEAWAHGNSFHFNDYASGDGSKRAFTLTYTPYSIIGVYVDDTAVSNYTVSGTTITFSAAPPSGSNNIRVYYVVNTTSDNARYYKEQAASSASSAYTSRTSAAESASSALSSAGSASSSASSASSSASTASTKAEEAANSASAASGSASTASTKASEASTSAGNASNSASTASTQAGNAEAWAVGQRGGSDVPPTDPTYQNNSKYYAELLEDEVDQLKNALESTTDTTIASWVDNKAYNATSVVTNLLPSDAVTENNYCCCYLPCQPGDTFKLTGKGSSAAKLFIFSASDGTIIRRASSDEVYADQYLVAPDNAAWLMCNSAMSKEHRLIKLPPDNVVLYPDLGNVTWTKRNLNDQGVISPNDTRILSTMMICTGSLRIDFTGATENSNNVPYFFGIAQYDAKENFIDRLIVYQASANKYSRIFVTRSDCRYIRYLYGHAYNSGVNIDIDTALSDFDVTVSYTGNSLDGTYIYPAIINFDADKDKSYVISFKTKYSGTQPTFVFSTPLYTSPVYPLGSTDGCTQMFRIPPALTGNNISININVASGTNVVISNTVIEKELVAPKINCGILYNAHLGFREMCPENTAIAVEYAGRLGYRSCIVVPKLTSDGKIVCCHDDTINRTARNNDGTSVSETINVSDLTYSELLEYDFGLYKNSYWKGQRILLFEDFLTMCASYGMIPTISVHPVFTAEKYEEMKEMVSKKGMLDVFHVKFWDPAHVILYSVFGEDIGEYTFEDYSIGNASGIKAQYNITKPKVSFEKGDYTWYTENNIKSCIDAGLSVIRTTSTSNNTTGALLLQNLEWGISQITDDTFCNNGLVWMPI